MPWRRRSGPSAELTEATHAPPAPGARDGPKEQKSLREGKKDQEVLLDGDRALRRNAFQPLGPLYG